MKLSEICIERPVFAWVMTLVIILVGIVLGKRLPLQQYPNFEQPVVGIETSYPGAAPEVVEAEVTKRYEEAFAGIEGIDFIQSISNAGSSNITIFFKESRNIDEAVNDVRDRISKERDNIPRDVKEPVISKTRYDESAIMSLSFWSDSMSRRELYDYITQTLKKDFESVQGVGRVDAYGEGLFVMNLYIDPKKMASFGVSIDEVMRAIQGQNLEKPAGTIISKSREYMVTTVAGLERPEQFDKMVIMSKNGLLVRLSDIGRSEISSAIAKTRSFFNGRQGISLNITKQSNVNPISVARGIKEKLESLKKYQIPEDVHVTVGFDSTLFVERSLKEVYRTIFEAIILVTLVVLLFLKSFRAALIPLVTIPVSLIGTFIFMHLFKFSLNTFTLLAFVLAVGLVVDDAIVVLENIHRYLEGGYSKIKAAVLGIREVSFAVMAMTLTLAAVYTPVSFATGFVGKLLTEFSIALACAVILSGFAALTLSPMMCAKILKSPKEETVSKYEIIRRIQNFVQIDAWMGVFAGVYEKTLRKYLGKKGIVITIALIFSLVGAAVFKALPSQRFPKEDNGTIRLEGHAPQSSTLEYTERYIQGADSLIADIPEIESRDFNITNPTFTGIITLKADKERSSEEIANEISKRFRSITGIDFQRIQAGFGGASGGGSEVQFVVRGNKSHKELRELARTVGLELKASGFVTQVLSEMQNDTEDYTITILRDKASSLFIDHHSIADTIDVLIRGRKTNTFKKDNKVYDVKVEVENSARSTPEDILNIHIKGGERRDKLVPLTELIEISPRSGPVEIHHYNRTRSVTVSATMDPRYGINDGVNKVNDAKKEILPKDVVLEFIGSTKTFLEEKSVMAMVFILALLFIYLVMAAQFESWIDPLIILFSVPLAIISAVLTLAIIKNGSINLYSNIGLITLIGLITKHGILIVDFANKIQLKGKSKYEAIVESALIRLRPVIMTTLAMVLGSLPLALSHGAGAETRWQLGWTIVGGMTFGTIFTLFVVPVFYVLMSRIKKPVKID
ncbi:MAG: efflux RND transporter permease subunit [Holosporales bacterium]|jgi:multidrug efflux pump|nr:efflux RND transporter permease subunit [Holosporales bacterium]